MFGQDFSRRSGQSEWMDGEDVPQEVYAACVTDLAKVNTVTLARPPTLAWLARATRGLPAGGRFSLLDVGYGDGDMLRAIAAWAGRRGLKPYLRGVDLNPRSEPVARAKSGPGGDIDYRTGDAFADARPVDFIVSSLVTHHMPDPDVVRFLAWMEATAARGWFVNDLHRRAPAYWGFRLLSTVAGWHPFVRHDGPISVARSFRPAEWARLLAAAGVPAGAARVRRRFPYRLCVERLR